MIVKQFSLNDFGLLFCSKVGVYLDQCDGMTNKVSIEDKVERKIY